MLRLRAAKIVYRKHKQQKVLGHRGASGSIPFTKGDQVVEMLYRTGERALGTVSSLLRKEDDSLFQKDAALVLNHCLDCKFKMSHSLSCLSDCASSGWLVESLHRESGLLCAPPF